MNRPLYLYVAAALVVLSLPGCGGKSGDTETEYVEPLTNVEIFEVQPSVFEEYLTLPVVVQPNRVVNLGLTAGGRVTGIKADKGDRVKKDMVLLETDDVLLRSQHANAKANLDYQRNEFARSEKLFRDGSITEAAFDGAKLQLSQAENAFDMAKKQLEDAVLKAPFSGIVTMRNIETGDILGPGTPAFRIIDMNMVKIQAGIPEKYITDFKVGNTVSVVFDSLPEKTFPGKINYVSPEANPSVRTFLAEIVVNNTEGVLRAGIMGNARILRKVHENAMMIPLNTIIETQKGRILFVARDNSTVEQRLVTLGGGGDTMIRVLTGISPGEKVVVKGQHDLVDGEKVNISGKIASAPIEESGQ